MYFGRKRSYQQWRAIFASLSRRQNIRPGRTRLRTAVLGRERIAETLREKRKAIRDPGDITMNASDLVRMLKERSLRKKSRTQKKLNVPYKQGSLEKAKGTPVGSWVSDDLTPASGEPTLRLSDSMREIPLVRPRILDTETPEGAAEASRLNRVAGDLQRRSARLRDQAEEFRLRLIPARRGGYMSRIHSTPKIDSISKAKALLASNRRVELARNTVLTRTIGGTQITYHNTAIVKFKDRSPAITLDTGGWKTRSTRSRMNHYTPPNVTIRGNTTIDNWHRRGQTPRPSSSVRRGQSSNIEWYVEIVQPIRNTRRLEVQRERVRRYRYEDGMTINPRTGTVKYRTRRR